MFSLLPPENATGNFTKIVQRVPVRIAIAPDVLSQGILRPGLSVVAKVDTRTRRRAATRRAEPTAMAAPAALPPLDKRRLVTFIFMVFGMFMAILDIQIVSASLSEIQAGLSASADEISWVQTSYLIAEVIMIPLSGMLSRVLSTRWMFTISAGGFTLMSVACASATSIEQMIVFRALQGFIGGGMIPTVFASAYTIFRGRQSDDLAGDRPRRHAGADHRADHRRLPHRPVLLALAVPGQRRAGHHGHRGRLAADRLRRAGSRAAEALRLGRPAFMAVMLGALEYVLEEGPGDDWFQDDLILLLAVVGAVAAVGFFWRAFNAKEPIVDLGAFADRNFAAGCAFSLIMGVGLYGLTYLYPVYLARVRGYSALQIGETMFVTGLCMFFMAPVAGKLMRVLDPRVMLAMGFVGFGAGTWIVTGLTKDWDFWELLLPQICRGVSLDAVHGDGQQHRPGHAAAGPAQERVGPVQPDPQPRRRHRPRADQHRPQQPHGPAPAAAARDGHLGQRRRARAAGRA